ncbi:MAG: hypothetical protein WAU86_05960 [Oricola sp.]
MTYGSNEWWDQAVERNRAALLRIVAVLFFRVGLDEGGAETLPRHVWRAVLLLLRPAESAARRLVIVTARDIAVTLRQRARSRFAWAGAAKSGGAGPQSPGEANSSDPAALPGDPTAGEAQLKVGAKTTTAWVSPPAERKPVSRTGLFYKGRLVRPGETPWAPKEPAGTSARPSFPLFDAPMGFDLDPPARRAKLPPVRSLFDDAVPFYLRRREPAVEPEPFDDGEVGAARLCRRLVALKQALDDLPGHAIRFARKNARRDHEQRSLLDRLATATVAEIEHLNGFCFAPPMRIGRPPGRRRRRLHPVDEILGECHGLALMSVRRRADTS